MAPGCRYLVCPVLAPQVVEFCVVLDNHWKQQKCLNSEPTEICFNQIYPEHLESIGLVWLLEYQSDSY